MLRKPGEESIFEKSSKMINWQITILRICSQMMAGFAFLAITNSK
jgi:hypothetical protein